MNRNHTEGSWKHLADTVQRRWGKLIDDQLDLWEEARAHPTQVADSWITAKVKAGIFNESSLKRSQINVETCKNVVQLSGFADVTTSMYKAVAIARSVKGVISVRNEMQFR